MNGSKNLWFIMIIVASCLKKNLRLANPQIGAPCHLGMTGQRGIYGRAACN